MVISAAVGDVSIEDDLATTMSAFKIGVRTDV